MKGINKNILFLIVLVVSLKLVANEPYRWPIKALDTARDVEYLTENEKDVVLELNKLRHNPKAYAAQYIKPLAGYYDGKLLKRPNEVWLQTNEGISAFNDCMKALFNAKPVQALTPSFGMSKACVGLVESQAKTGKTGHNDHNGNNAFERMKTYGEFVGYAGENIHYGMIDPVMVIVSLAIDDGVESRGHRNAMLDEKFNRIGVASGPHKIYGNMCVQNFATQFHEKKVN